MTVILSQLNRGEERNHITYFPLVDSGHAYWSRHAVLSPFSVFSLSLSLSLFLSLSAFYLYFHSVLPHLLCAWHHYLSLFFSLSFFISCSTPPFLSVSLSQPPTPQSGLEKHRKINDKNTALSDTHTHALTLQARASVSTSCSSSPSDWTCQFHLRNWTRLLLQRDADSCHRTPPASVRRTPQLFHLHSAIVTVYNQGNLQTLTC